MSKGWAGCPKLGHFTMRQKNLYTKAQYFHTFLFAGKLSVNSPKIIFLDK